MNIYHKIALCVATFYLSVGSTFAFAVEPETQTIIDSANALDAKLVSATGPVTNVFHTNSYSEVTVNGVPVVGVPCNDARVPTEEQSAHSFCYVLVR